MDIIKTGLEGVFIVNPKVFTDNRGYFFESFRKSFIEAAIGEKVDFLQDNESKSLKGTLRGLHYQLPPFSQAKLVRVVKGAILDVAVDIRRSSETFGRYVAVELNEENKYQLFIPNGFAHGFLTLQDDTIVAYKVDNYYSKGHDRGIRFDDPKIAINWPIGKGKILLSEKDKALPYLEDAEVFL